MEELLELKGLLLQGDISGALAIVEDLEEMSRDDKINNIRSYTFILLLHLIKQQAEKRTTRFWDVSIRNSVREIREKNKRRKAGGHYLNPEDLLQILEVAYEMEELENLLNQQEIINHALALIDPTANSNT